MVSAFVHFDGANGFPQAFVRVGSVGTSTSAMAWVGGGLTPNPDILARSNRDKRA